MHLAKIFNDHMVLQRNREICIFGYGKGNGVIEFQGKTYSFTSEKESFNVYLPPHSEGGPYEMKVTLNGESKTIKDIMIGEVYIAAGQSNMALTLGRTIDIDYVDNNNVRFFTEPNDANENGIPSFNSPDWFICNSKLVDNFSAIGYYFAVELQKHIGVPVGVVSCSKGASRIDAWTAPEIVQAAKYQNMIAIKHRDYEAFKFNQNSWLYKNKLLQIVPFSNSGILWYQGESNRCHEEGAYYRDMLEILVNNWRELWDYNLPFYCIQLMPFNETPANADWAIIREQQELASKTIENFYLITLFNTKEADSIHPLQKKDVSYALSNAVRKIQFNENLEYCGPILEKYERQDNYIKLYFSHADGLFINGDTLLDTYIYDKNSQYIATQIIIEDNYIKLFWDDNIMPIRLSMGYNNAPEHNLYNKFGYLSSPFNLHF